MNLTNISQLAQTTSTVASGLSRGLSVASNFTQPFSNGNAPSSPLRSSVSLAASFATSLGSSSINESAAAAIAQKVSNTPSSSLSSLGSGFISAIGSSSDALSFASDALKGLKASPLSGVGSLVAGANFATGGALADVANAAFGVGSEELGGLLNLSGENALSSLLGGGGEESGLTVDDVIDPETIPSDWVFITAPQDVSWDKQGQVSSVDNFGTNSPYVIYSSTGMRKLTLGETLIEGFSAGKEVEDHIIKLESMMNMVMNGGTGYVSPYVWDLRAGDKSYGKFVIESLQIKEAMRNEKGRADRATASITLQQVPDFQVNDGRDLATQADLASGKSIQSKKDKKAEADGKGGSKAKPGKKDQKDKEPRPVKVPTLFQIT